MPRNKSSNKSSQEFAPTLQPEQPDRSFEPMPRDRSSEFGASDPVSALSAAATSLKDDAKQAAQAAARAVKEQSSQFASDVAHELGKTADAQKDRGVEAINGFVRAINAAAGDLEQQSPLIAQYVRDTASKVETLSQNISNRNASELMKAATDLARSQPVLFFGGAIAAGFVLSRFLKSSTPPPAAPEPQGDAFAHHEYKAEEMAVQP
jgi:hypothetical protein